MTADVIGRDELLQKSSAVDASGRNKTVQIEGLNFRPVRPVPHEDGHVTEIARTTWECITAPIVQVHLTTTLPGRIRAWGLHTRSTDRLFVVSGLVRFVVFDGRKGSPTEGCLNELMSSASSPGLLTIPPNLFHGWKNIGTEDAAIINMPDRLYNYDEPDALDLPWDWEAARRTISYAW